MTIILVVGARPNFVKTAPILAQLRQRAEVSSVLVHTGQHHDDTLSGSFFRDLDIPPPDVHLGVTSDTPPARLAEMIARLAPIFSAHQADLALLVGDVDSTLAGALAAAKCGIPIAHVEAGLRSFDRTMPEEINRVLTDSVTEYYFTTGPSANRNLAREGVPPHRIHYVGNVMIDTLVRLRGRIATSRILDVCGLTPREYAVLTLHRPSNVDDVASLNQVLGAMSEVSAEVPIVFPVHPRTRRRLDTLPAGSPALKSLRLLEPLPYLDFVRLMELATVVLTDSGGIQEETTALGVPCLTLPSVRSRPRREPTRSSVSIPAELPPHGSASAVVAGEQVGVRPCGTGALPSASSRSSRHGRVRDTGGNPDAPPSHHHGSPPRFRRVGRSCGAPERCFPAARLSIRRSVPPNDVGRRRCTV